MNNEQLGMYFRLTCYDWTEGSLPDNPDALQELAEAPEGSPFQSMWQLVGDKYASVTAGRISHRRLILQREQNKTFSESQRFRAKAPRSSPRLAGASRGLSPASHIDPDPDLDKKEEEKRPQRRQEKPEEKINFNRKAKANASDFDGPGMETLMARLREYEDEFGKAWCDARWYKAVEWAFDHPDRAKKSWRKYLINWFSGDAATARERRKDA